MTPPLLLLLQVALAVGVWGGDTQFITWDDFRSSKDSGHHTDAKERVIYVAKNGLGHSRTVQGAVDLVHEENQNRVKIFIGPGTYREKVLIPSSKPYISFIGNGTSETIISWDLRASYKDQTGDEIGTLNSASVAVEADYFCATGITFENTAPTAPAGGAGTQAVALRVAGDKAMFYKCRIKSSQDTLFDQTGRHFFYKCFIQGSIDFIFGSAKSIYKDCTINSNAQTFGAIAASQRESESEDAGFSFHNCKVTGTGDVWLGRAWGKYATTVYVGCEIGGMINPQGWNDWGDPSRRSTALFGEYKCTGAGANKTGRVPWERTFTYNQIKPYVDQSYIEGEQWLKL